MTDSREQVNNPSFSQSSEARPTEAAEDPTLFLTVRAGLAEDLSWLADQEKEIFSDPWSFESIHSQWQAGQKPETWPGLHLLRFHGQRIGYAMTGLVLEELQLYRIALVQDFRGQGFAKFLLHGVVSAALPYGAQVCTLEVRAGNLSALALYQSLGFQRVGRRPNYYRDPGEDAVLMDWTLEKKA